MMMFRGDDLSIGGELDAFRGIGRFVSFFFFFEEEGEKLYERRLGKNIMVNHIADLER